MSIETIFINNLAEEVRLPEGMRLPDCVHEVEIRAIGNERIIAPRGQTWDSFFFEGSSATDDFERANQHPENGAGEALRPAQKAAARLRSAQE